MYTTHFKRAFAAFLLAGSALTFAPLHAQDPLVRVETEYGREKVTPRAGTITVGLNTEQTFDAPEFVYLNRDFEELDAIGSVNDPDHSKVAYYRARNVGYAINGDEVQGAERFFKQTITSDTTIVWKWELDYAVFIESAAMNGQPLPGNPGDGIGNPNPVVGREWAAKDTEFTAAIDRTVGNDTLGLDISGFRYSAEAYELENVRGAPLGSPSDTYTPFKEAQGFGTSIEQAVLEPEKDGFTMAWWGKIDRKLDSKRDQIFLTLTQTLNYAEYIFTPADADGVKHIVNSTRFGVRDDGQFFVEEVVPTVAVPAGEFRELASLPSALVGFEWHHWAVVFDFPQADLTKRDIRIYRDGALVFNRSMPIPLDLDAPPNAPLPPVPTTHPSYKPVLLQAGTRWINFGFIPYETVAPASTRFEKLEGGLNNLSLWLEALQPDPLDPSRVTAIDQQARATGGDVNFGGLSDSPEFPPTARTALRDDKGPVLLGDTGDRLVTESVTIDDWLRVRWLWSAQVRYRFDAAGGNPGDGESEFLGQSFVRTFQFDNPVTPEDESLLPEPDSPPASPNPRFGEASFNEVWIDVGRKVEVGAFYRTADNCFTMRDMASSPSGDFGGLGTRIADLSDITLMDSADESRVARVWRVPAAKAPSEISFLYEPTTFRAEIPLGGSFDAMNPNLQLVPPLCKDGILRTGSLGPEGPFNPVGPEAPGFITGLPARWDQLGKRLFPVHPGTFQVAWPDERFPDEVSYNIEIVSGYPGEDVPLITDRELPTGMREVLVAGNPPTYVREITLPATDSKFPASPGAHYRHGYDSKVGRRPPTKLDLSATDHWKFEELTYTDRDVTASVDTGAAGTPFTAAGTGRSVLLYSFRPNPGEVADGTPTKENLAVRVVHSIPLESILPDDPANPLGRRGLELGAGSADNDGAVGVISRGGAAPSVDAGLPFVLDFWLNTKHLQPDDGPVTILTTGTGELEVTLDPANSTITASYFNLSATHPVSMAGAGWSHYVIHVFGEIFFGIPVTLLDFRADGLREEDGLVTALLTAGHSPAFTVATTLDPTSLQFGADANPESRLQLDQVRLFSTPGTYLTPGEVRSLREVRSTSLREAGALLHFDFEEEPSLATTGVYSFVNGGTVANVGVGPNFGSGPDGDWAGLWARLDIQEVATRLDSPLDDADFNGSGYILNEFSNYNPNLYVRTAEVGTWGPVFPVNEKRLFTGQMERLEIAYYENPYRLDELSHPNVAWPYISMGYDEVIYPTYGPHKDKAVYVASRIGSEGVDQKGKLQQVFTADQYADLQIYNQPLRGEPGYNPNEEHALVAAAGRAGLKLKNLGEDIPNNPPLAAFALQKDINVANVADVMTYTSHPWVLVQVQNRQTGEPEMAAYQVFKTRVGTIHFPRPTDFRVETTPGLAYESAANPEDRFLTMEPDGTYDFAYAFSYPIAAGDLLIPPYPLNLVIGNAAMRDTRGGDNSGQRTLWKDVYGNAWAVSGGGTFFYQFFYPFRSDFYLESTPVGTPVAWVPDSIPGIRPTFTGNGPSLNPGKVVYASFWRSGYPKLKRGETLTYQGGEYFNENPGSNGLPALVAMKAAEIVYDNATPTMMIGEDNLGDFSARIIRALDRHEAPFSVADMRDAGFTPDADTKIFIVAERWYFKQLPGSLQKRFYFDSLAEKLVFRGYLNDKDSGDPDLTSGPDPINILEPNIVTADDEARLAAIGEGGDWATAIDAISFQSQNPTLVRDDDGSEYPPVTGKYLAGMKESPVFTDRIGLNMDLYDASADLTEVTERISKLATDLRILEEPWTIRTDPNYEVTLGQAALRAGIVLSTVEAIALVGDISRLGYQILKLPPVAESHYAHLDSFGVGSALVCNPKLLTSPTNGGSQYITIVENNRAELNGAPITIHIIEIIPDRYRGAIKVIEAADAFSEKISLQHNGEFGANTNDLYYEWWIRDAGPLDVVADEVLADGSLKDVDSRGNSLWQQYMPERDEAVLQQFTDQGIPLATAKHLGLHSVVFEGSPAVVLADKLVLVRYKHVSEVDSTPDDNDNWTLVPFEITDPPVEWAPGSRAPFQWAGAANSPQLQADGSKRYIPQLVMGWVKRILDRINPYEARYTDFFSNESPATYSSQIQIAGAPFAGKVALNPDKNVIENTGLIELYETVLQRAKELSIDNSSNPVSTDGINQALLLAATRLAVLYELLAREAYSDAQDATIKVPDSNTGLAAVASFTHAFQGFESDLLNEELALLRGTDFRKSYPVFNRMFWNYTKGLGEAAYNVNYNIYDENTDGFINEDDARALFPQGHGDAWGHFLSALGMHYELLQQPVFSWKSRSELYSLMQNVLEVDYLDEKTFAKLAASRARTGRDIVRSTYRLHYTQDPDGQWQGYSDGADPARAWGVSEWAHRSGQAAYFDWTVANALLPEEAGDATPVEDPENLDFIERSGAEAELGEVVAGLYEIQVAMDEANNGVNPLGFDSDSIAFDLDPTFIRLGPGISGATHFEQIYGRAVTAGTNAVEALKFATGVENKLRRVADDTDGLMVEALRQDIAYRNRLIEIFGRPYDGTIGFGKLYPEGYEGPDTLLYSYLDRTTAAEIVPDGTSNPDGSALTFNEIKGTVLGLASDQTLLNIYYDSSGNSSPELTQAMQTFIAGNDYQDPTKQITMPISRASDYAFRASPDWGQRTSYGKIQRALEKMLREEVALRGAIEDYQGFLGDFETLTLRLLNEIELVDEREDIANAITGVRAGFNTALVIARAAAEIATTIEETAGTAQKISVTAVAGVIGFSNDALSAVRASFTAATEAVMLLGSRGKAFADAAIDAAELIRDEIIAALEGDLTRVDYVSEIEGMLADIEMLSGSDGPLRAKIGTHLQTLEILRQEYFTALAEGFRVLREREAFNKILAAKVQKNRYKDMLFRLSRNEAMSNYQSAFNHAARYAWLTAKAYDYETSLDPGDPAAATQLLDRIVKTRQLGLWSNGPQVGQGGLAEILASLNGNFLVLKNQLGINTLQVANEDISLRGELFRIGPGAGNGGVAASDDRWVDALKARIVEDLWQMPEFQRHCRPFANRADGPQPGLVIRFRTTIEPGLNFFGRPLAAGDHAYSSANYSTKIGTAGIFLDDYPETNLATTPRAYLVPVGNDYMRVSTADEPTTRMWTVHDTRIPTPFTINQSNLTAPGFIPSLDGVDGRFSEPRRHADFRMYHEPGVSVTDAEQGTRLIGRSIWNSDWLLVIPGVGLHADADFGLQQFAEQVTDLKLTFKTYSHNGQ